eukprot:COSAG01_NODE_15599_length_1320_cov_5.746929_2_plen_130_part_00
MDFTMEATSTYVLAIRSYYRYMVLSPSSSDSGSEKVLRQGAIGITYYDNEGKADDQRFVVQICFYNGDGELGIHNDVEGQPMTCWVNADAFKKPNHGPNSQYPLVHGWNMRRNVWNHGRCYTNLGTKCR